MTNAPAAWYPAPDDPGRVRYWDGIAWTDQYAPESPAFAKAVAATAKKNSKVLAHNQKVQIKQQRQAAEILGKAEAKYTLDLAAWQETRDAQAHVLDLVTNYGGEPHATELMLKKDEELFGTVSSAALIEERAGQGQFVGRSQGFSIPVGSLGGHSIRYRVSASKGHFVAAPPVPTAIDHGTLYITNQRIVFQGSRQTRECLYVKLVAFQTAENGAATFSVSNRQKPTVVQYGAEIAPWFDLRLQIALAHFRGTLPDLVSKAQVELNSVDARKPVDPVTVAATV
jgi:hypothetical protein